MNNNLHDIEISQKNFYLKKFDRYGDSPKALSWNDKNTQNLRFEALSNLFRHEYGNIFSVHEVGCGLAHFKEYLQDKFREAEYSGSDIIPEFINYNNKKYPSTKFFIRNIAEDISNLNPKLIVFDYYCLNGTFHTKELNSTNNWENFIFKSIRNMFACAKKGIAFNFLTSFSDFYDPSLYYANPATILDWCLENCSRFVSISHDLPLYEFFVYIYKEEFIKEKNPDFNKYFKI